MKTILLVSVFFLLPFIAIAQRADSLSVVKQVDSLIQVSRSLTEQQEFGKALEVIATAEKIALEKLGRNSAGYAGCCFNRGRVNYFKGDFPEAEKGYLEALNLRSITPGIGKKHADYAQSLNNLGLLHFDLGNFEKAETLYLEALEIRARATGIGKEHQDYAQSLFNLANLYETMGNFEKAEPLYLEAKSIREKTLGKDDPNYATSLNGLANLHWHLGNYEKAESLYLEAKIIWEKALGKEHPDYGISLHNLALLYETMGNFEKAEPLYLEAVNIDEKKLGREHPSYAHSLFTLGHFYYKIGKFQKAETYYLEALAIRSQAHNIGKEHANYAKSLHNLAELYREMSLFKKAEPLYLEAKAIYERSLGKSHPHYATILNDMALYYQGIDMFKKAEPLFLESKVIFEKSLGKEHPRYAGILKGLAVFYQKTDRIPLSNSHFLEMNRVNRKQLERAATYSSENAMLAYLQTFKTDIARFYSFVQAHQNPELCRESFNNVLFFNGLVLENSRQLAKAVAEADSLTRELYQKWQGCHRRLAKRYARPIEDRKKIAEVEAEAEGFEKLLMRSLPAFQEARKRATWQDVRDRLKAGESAVEFLHYRFYAPEETDRIQYAALVLRPGFEAPKLIPLFEEKQLDSLLQTSSGRKADYVSNLYSVADRGIIVLDKHQKTLFEMIWQPLERELNVGGSTHTVYFSPTGLLHRLNLGAIPISHLEGGLGGAGFYSCRPIPTDCIGKYAAVGHPNGFSIQQQ